ncbi:hypothetical protein CONPUDRAFT_140851 [Coniophora puteana RWD-64-598 SS2]|uniref:F-box domain-containing protein n=1 Tax=Coniophora puteana (strain RWD-64-598) TaxID=741705 RepID=A0A5M3N5H5_CONPW|nr:uncharacterized protein CONPUDRAFT_140851 [Coniophora puteana RWD-64-598 SS2]EIW86171.1 hypothetical protein CONPUDRAFT_140851 [Coniophora puteana RWD-64-598 SS2]
MKPVKKQRERPSNTSGIFDDAKARSRLGLCWMEIARTTRTVGQLIVLSSYSPVQMDKALSLPEIRHQLCEQITIQGTLFNLAQTSTSFQQPSLNRLWSGEIAPIPISHLRHVVDPNAIVMVEERTKVGTIVDLNLGSEDWDRISIHTKRIVHMSINHVPSLEPDFHHSVLVKLLSTSSSLEGGFPRLRHLIAGYSSRSSRTDDLHTYIRFFSPQLLSATVVCDPESRPKMVKTLLERCPDLQRLSVIDEHETMNSPDSMSRVSSLVTRFLSLSTLKCYNLSREALLNISRSSHLRHLVLANQDWDQTISNAFGLPSFTLSFPALQILELNPHESASVITFLSRLEAIPRILKIVGSDLSINVDEMLEIFMVLSQARRTQLSELTLDARYSATDSENVITMSTLRPLMQHRELRNLSINLPHVISLSVDGIQEFRQAFPNLEKVQFNPSSKSSISLDWLFALSRECPKLTDVTLPLDVSTQNMQAIHPNAPAERSHLQHALLSLHGTTNIDILLQTTAAHFPSMTTLTLDELRSSGDDSDEDTGAVTMACIAPLLQLDQIRSLSLHLARVFQLTDTDVLHIATAFPHLTCLELGGWSSDMLNSLVVTIDTVLALTDLCPSLSELTIRVDTTDCFNRSSLEQRLEVREGRPNKVLKKLDFLYSTIKGKDVGDLVILLAVVYKRLSSLSIGGSIFFRPAYFLVEKLFRAVRGVERFRELGVRDIPRLRAALKPILEEQQRPIADFNFPELRVLPDGDSRGRGCFGNRGFAARCILLPSTIAAPGYRPTMHSALKLTEILEEVFSCFDDMDSHTPFSPPYSRFLRGRTLARLARTCKAFKKPAIDELWSDIPALTIYECLLPHLTVMWKDGDLDPYEWRSRAANKTWVADVRPLSITDQLNVVEYTSAIRKLRFASFTETAIAPPALRALLSLPGGVEAAFPRLNHVHVGHFLPSLLQVYLSFVAHVGSIHIDSFNVDDDLTEFLTGFTTREGPPVRGMDLSLFYSGSDSDPEYQNLPPALSQAIMRCQHLRTLRCAEMDQATLVHLSQLPSLTSLELEIIYDIRSTPTLPFPSLKSLTLDFRLYVYAVFFIFKLARIPSSITLRTKDQPSSHVSGQLFKVLSRRWHSEAKLQHLTLSHTHFEWHPTDDQPTTISTIRPILRFADMRIFDWIFPGEIHLTDADVALITGAWPLLEQLRIQSLSKDYVPTTTLGSVFIAAHNCPRLGRFTMHVDASQFADVYTKDAHADLFRRERMKAIELGRSFIDARGLATIAAAFAQAFPRLSFIQLDMPVADEDIDDSEAIDVDESEESQGTDTDDSEATNSDIDDSQARDTGPRPYGGRLLKAIETLRQAKESWRITSWTDEAALSILVRYFEASWNTDRKGTYSNYDEILSCL